MELFPLQPKIEPKLPKPFDTLFKGITVVDGNALFIFESPQIGIICLHNVNPNNPELCKEYEVPNDLFNAHFSINREYEGIIFYDAVAESQSGYCQPVFLVEDNDHKTERLNLFLERIDLYQEYSLSYTLYSCAKVILAVDTNSLNLN